MQQDGTLLNNRDGETIETGHHEILIIGIGTMKINTLNPIRITKIGDLLPQIIHYQIIEIITLDQEDKVTTGITVKIHKQAPMKIKRIICQFVYWEWII